MPQRTTEQSIRLLTQVVLSVVAWCVAAFVVNTQLASHDYGPVGRGVLAGVGIAAFLGWLFFAARSVLVQDEFTQRIHFVAIAVAFAATAAISLSADFLRKAGFIQVLPFENAWMLMVVLWAIALAGTSRYYR